MAVYSVYNNGQYCVSTSQVSSAIQRAATHLGEEPRHFSSYTLRSSDETLLYRGEIDAMAIHSHSRWSSECSKLYVSLCEESVSVIASKFVGGAKRGSTQR